MPDQKSIRRKAAEGRQPERDGETVGVAARERAPGHAEAHTRERALSGVGMTPSGDGDLDVYELLDKSAHAALSHLTLGIAPSALAAAYTDWMTHLATSPGKQAELLHKSWRKAMRLGAFAQCQLAEGAKDPCIEPLPQDHRFRDVSWQTWPFNFMYQQFLLQQQWWHNATTGIRGVSPKHEQIVTFVARQILDTFSPSNSPFTNPEVQQATMAEGGANLLRGARNLAEDVVRFATKTPAPELAEFRPGEKLATAPGKVVFRNRLIELIQYAPQTEEVHARPILIVPAWIMKYYILDLSPHNSMVRHLTEQGFTVFMISWLNPDEADRDLSMEDYRKLGVMAAIDAACAISGSPDINAMGYCLGGTMLSIAAAAMARDGDDRLASLTFLAAQTDFREAGELTLFISESQVSFLEDMMWEQGFLATEQMGGAFRLLRSVDLIWSRNVHDYLMGKRMPMFDLLAWNADGTRLPYRMHSEYLRKLFLSNDLAEGRYIVEGRPISVSDIRVPILAVGTEEDHVAPWRSVYKFHHVADTQVTFILTNGGHNAGIVSEPGHKGRRYRMAVTPAEALYTDADNWVEKAPLFEGSWWTALVDWLDGKSGEMVPPPPLGRDGTPYEAICDAPGTFVLKP
ncbi:alpha/beta fold hydrolase [Stappia sp.]|uniref:PHA/PHB synthase family protein n=1 Tax=Stappia sp. TaxID=1870903 RepID=UPI0025E82BC7|nr:alpha/beta fold hydrolase [Stappia sp.]